MGVQRANSPQTLHLGSSLLKQGRLDSTADTLELETPTLIMNFSQLKLRTFFDFLKKEKNIKLYFT